MKNFFAEFKKFITRGNVVDMAVGVIVGGAFTAIVNGMSNFILKPIINWLLALVLGANKLSELYTMLKPAYLLDDAGNATKELDLANSIYINCGEFINAIINFLLIALVLFIIVRFINKVRSNDEKRRDYRPTKEERKEMKALGIKRHDKEAVAAYYAEKALAAEEAKAVADALAAEQARLEREANPTTEDLLKQILAQMQKQA
jgi:large conductance mechanosensitive channel